MRLGWGLVGLHWEGKDGVPACGFGEGGGLDEGSLNPGVLDLGLFETAHDQMLRYVIPGLYWERAS